MVSRITTSDSDIAIFLPPVYAQLRNNADSLAAFETSSSSTRVTRRAGARAAAAQEGSEGKRHDMLAQAGDLTDL